ncbi:dynamin family protein [Pseudonocardia sp. Cha107L01]|uniref:dynamin family protein n=1 Tax=Pseudonocardia sp. Cha107L01 TaxID=3457576 RepID=UPI00403E89A6
MNTGSSIGTRFWMGAGVSTGTGFGLGAGVSTGTEVDRARLIIRDARADFADDPSVAAELAECERRLDEPLRVALVGKLKSGKSTLLNALVGEEIAPTDATECTRVVTWFHRCAGPRIELTHDGGRRTPLPVRRTDGRLRLDLGPVPADRVERLVVGWPSALLDSYTVIDTPGTSSNSADVSARTMAFLAPEDGACEAEAVIFLMRSRHDSDVALLRQLQEQTGAGGPLGIVGVLSRADELGGGAVGSGAVGSGAVGSAGALGAARQRSAELRTDPELGGLHRDFVAVSGLLALRGQTLRQREFAALAALAGLPDDVLGAALVSAGRFAGAELGVSAEEREWLLEAFGLVGVRIAVDLVRGGARDAPALAAALVRHSGLDELHRVLDARFASRHGQLKAHAALRTVHRVLLRQPATRSARLLRAVERLLADSHAGTEVRVLAGVAALPVAEPTRDALERVLGGRGTSAAARLGLPAHADRQQLHTAALHAIGHWRNQLDHPLLDRPTERAYRAAVRSCEAIVAH